MEAEAIGELVVPNVGAGDIVVTFNNHDTGETAKALRMLTDMQARGYAILVKMPDETYVRATEIDATRGHYVVVLPEHVETPETAVERTCRCGCGVAVADGKTWVKGHHNRAKTGARKVGVPIRTSRATGIARSAGG